jgi:hypothetical protein
MMSGQLILSCKPFNTFSIVKNIAIASDPHSKAACHKKEKNLPVIREL